MIQLAAYVGCAILVALAVFQVALILGAPIGKYSWGGQHTVLPPKLRVASITSIFLYMLFAAVLATEAGVATRIPNGQVTDVAIWVMTAYFFLGVIMNGISRSKPERNVMTPTALLLALIFLYVALA